MKTLYIQTNHDSRKAISFVSQGSDGANDYQTFWQDKKYLWKHWSGSSGESEQQYNRKLLTFANIHCYILFKQGLI